MSVSRVPFTFFYGVARNPPLRIRGYPLIRQSLIITRIAPVNWCTAWHRCVERIEIEDRVSYYLSAMSSQIPVDSADNISAQASLPGRK